MGDGANDALRGYLKAGIPRGSKVGKACPICGKWSYTSNRCHPDQGMFCKGQTMSQVFKPGMYVLINNGLMKVLTVNGNDFSFTCVNGAWSGKYSNGQVYVDEMREWYSGEIISAVQPPATMKDYGDIIDWMRLNR